MDIEIITRNTITVAVVSSTEKIMKDVPSALDLIMSVSYQTQANRIAIDKKAITEDFFILSTGLAGDILQKFINYKTKIAIYGDFAKYTSQPLKDFMYESNKGKNIFFTGIKEEAIERLCNAGE